MRKPPLIGFSLQMGKSLETKLDTFIYFNKLPAELRVKIWKYLLPGPRIVPVAFDIRGHGLLSTAKPPTLLRVSREARLEAQREYPPAFAIDGVSTIVPFNFELDTMLILPPDFRDQRFSKSVLDYYSRLPLQDRSKVRSLALDCQDAFYCETLTQQAGKFFPKISTLVLLRCSRSTKNCSCNPPCLRWRSTMVTTTTNPYNFSQLATINRFKLAWTKANGGQNDLSFPRVETGVLMMSCTKISPGDCTILPQYLGRKTGNPRRSGRSGIKKDYNEIKLGS